MCALSCPASRFKATSFGVFHSNREWTKNLRPCFRVLFHPVSFTALKSLRATSSLLSASNPLPGPCSAHLLSCFCIRLHPLQMPRQPWLSLTCFFSWFLHNLLWGPGRAPRKEVACLGSSAGTLAWSARKKHGAPADSDSRQLISLPRFWRLEIQGQGTSWADSF